MFEKISRLWKGDPALKKQYKQFAKMLELDRQLYKQVLDAMNRGTDLCGLEETVYRGDIEINKLERRIRKEIVTHLALNPGDEVTGCLVLMSIVKDAERLGDLCKNLYESTICWGRPVSELKFAAKINELQLYVSDTFDSTIKAFEEEDDVLAGEIIRDEVLWNKRFDAFLNELAGSDVATREAVSTTLFVRNFKRLQAHLSNIASSVVMPLHQIDHRPKELRTSGREGKTS